jgi:MFS family permease
MRMKRWAVLIGSAIGLAVSVGPFFWLALGLYLKPMTTEFGWTRSEFALSFSIASVVNALMLPVAGYLVDRFGAPKIILLGIVTGTLSYAGFSLVSSYWSFLLAACVVAGTGCLASYPSYLALLPGWFNRRLGLSFALAASGVGLGGAIFPYIVNAGVGYGWRTAFLSTAAFAAIIGLTNFATLIRVNSGALPEAERFSDPALEPVSVDHSVSEALRSLDFWLYSIAFSFVLLVTLGVNFHFAALVSDRGGTATQAATVVSALGIASLVARLLTGPLLDRCSVRAVAIFAFLGQAMGCLLLFGGQGYAVLLIAAVLLGIAQGAELDMLPFVTARRFGRRAYAQIYGSSYAVIAVGQIVSPLILGWIFDLTGSYRLGLILFPILSVIALLFVLVARQSPRMAGATITPSNRPGLGGTASAYTTTH